MNRTRRSLVSISVVALSALVLVGCGGDEKAGSDRPNRSAAGWLDARICVVNVSGDALEVFFENLDDGEDVLPTEPVGRTELCGRGTSYWESVSVLDESGNLVYEVYWENYVAGTPYVQISDTGDRPLCKKGNLDEGDAFVMEPCRRPYRLEVLRRPDSADHKELFVRISR